MKLPAHAPGGAEIIFLGSYYKVGRFSKVFYFCSGEWRLSAKSLTEMQVMRDAYKVQTEDYYRKFKVSFNEDTFSFNARVSYRSASGKAQCKSLSFPTLAEALERAA